MSRPSVARPRMLVVGGTGGLAGRALLEQVRKDWVVRSVHRHPVPAEIAAGVEWVRGDAGTIEWDPVLREVDAVVNLAWYRHGSARRFRPLTEGLLRLIRASERAGIRRFVQLSVPEAPAALETGLPYLVGKRVVDRALAESRLSHAILRASMLFGPRDKLLTVMLRTMYRYHRFPMFGDGEYHLSPIAAADIARILVRETQGTACGTFNAGGPTRWRYRDLTDRMFSAIGRPPQYLRLTVKGGIRLARLLETFGSSLLYAYEVEWLVSDHLGLPAYRGLDAPLTEVGPFLERAASELAGRAFVPTVASSGPPTG
jgi:uncharacterized protein YbjT (DUF2867 family)